MHADGSVPPTERYHRVQRFQHDPPEACRVALLSMLAAGQGITLTAARMVRQQAGRQRGHRETTVPARACVPAASADSKPSHSSHHHQVALTDWPTADGMMHDGRLACMAQVVFAELHWVPGVLQQAEDRAHRIGQAHDNVHVVRGPPGVG